MENYAFENILDLAVLYVFEKHTIYMFLKTYKTVKLSMFLGVLVIFLSFNPIFWQIFAGYPMLCFS